MCGCEAWSVTLRDGQKIGMIENGVLRQVVERKREKITGVWRRLLKEERYDLCYSANVIRAIIFITKNEMTGHVA